MKARNKTAGFHVIELVLVLAVVAVLGFVGWRVWEAQVAKQGTTTNTVQDEVPEVNKASDLDAVNSTIDQIDLDESSQELSDLEKELDSL